MVQLVHFSNITNDWRLLKLIWSDLFSLTFKDHFPHITFIDVYLFIYFNIFIQDNKFSKAAFQLGPV